MTLKSGETLLIREAKASDAKAVLEYVDRISTQSDFLTFGQGEFVMSIEQEEKFLGDAAMRNNALYLVAEIGGKLVGGLNFSGGIRPRLAHIGEFGVSVLKEYWGNGIGTELIKSLLEWAKQTGIIRKINLVVRQDNLKAIHVYKGLGFIKEGVITRDMQIDGIFYDAIQMGLAID